MPPVDVVRYEQQEATPVADDSDEQWECVSVDTDIMNNGRVHSYC